MAATRTEHGPVEAAHRTASERHGANVAAAGDERVVQIGREDLRAAAIVVGDDLEDGAGHSGDGARQLPAAVSTSQACNTG